jgi:hypothetical protein
MKLFLVIFLSLSFSVASARECGAVISVLLDVANNKTSFALQIGTKNKWFFPNKDNTSMATTILAAKGSQSLVCVTSKNNIITSIQIGDIISDDSDEK